MADSLASRKLKVLIVTALPPWYRGGVERVVGETAKQLVLNQNAEVEIRCGDLYASQSLVWNGIPVKTYKTTRWQRFASVEMLKEIKRDAKMFDVIHAHGYHTLSSSLAAAERGSTPFVFSAHFHPAASSRALAPVKWIYDRLFNARIFKNSARIICVSETEKKFIRQRFKLPTDSSIVIPNGVNAGEIARANPYKIDYKLILSVGRLVKHKQNQLTIEAMKYIPECYRFYMIGNGGYKRKLEVMARKYGLEARVKVLDSCSDEEVYRWLQTCAVIVNLSEIEAFGITVLEGLAAGKGVIVNNKLGLAELARRFEGAVFPVDREETDSVELAKIIEDVATKRIDRVDLHEFRWDRIAQRVLAVYLDIYQSQRSELALRNV